MLAALALLAGTQGKAVAQAAQLSAPYPPSEVITQVNWAPKQTIVRKAHDSDNWPMTWADDGALYSAYGDGYGFEPFLPDKLSLGLAKVTGAPPAFAGENIRAPSLEQRGRGRSGRKASGLLCVDGVLSLWARNATNSQLAWSGDHGLTWRWADWQLTNSFGCPTFLNFGRNYAGAHDEFVYIYSPDTDSAYEAADRLVLARVPKTQIRERAAYEFFSGLNAGEATWSRDLARRGAVFSAAGLCYRCGVTYDAALKRYLLVQPVVTSASRDSTGKIDVRFAGGLAVYDAPAPWGPWTTAYFTNQWDVGPGDSASFPTKWMSADGKTLYLVFSGDDNFSLRKAEFQVSPNNGAPQGSTVWPGKDWLTATPESQGMSGEALAEAEAYAQKYSGTSGCVIRHGYLVKEWGPTTALTDIKSAAKAAVGATVLGLAVDAGLVKLDDPAQKYYPNIGAEKPENVVTGWLPEVTVRELATMTAGFDDGRPPKLVRRPGSGGEYSNDTANMQAELLTLVFGEDLYTLFKRKVMDPIDAPESEWRWRENGYRPKTINGLKAREFASGITITHRALARIGYLYLRGGNWNGQQILLPEYIQAATQPTTLPAPYMYYGFYWGSNAKGQLPDVPRDIYWALGLGESILVVCPSLDIVAVRMGAGSRKSILPPFTTDWDQKTAGFFKLVARAVTQTNPPAWDWTTASPESQGMSSTRLKEMKDDLAAHKTSGLLVIRNDKIVCEWYAPGLCATNPHGTASMAKALVGGVSLAVALTDGRIVLDDPAAKFVPQWQQDARKHRITIRQLGSHTSGLADAEDQSIPHDKLTGWAGDFWKRLAPPQDSFTIARDLTPMLSEPGERFQYSNPGIAMLAYAITGALQDAPQTDLRTLLRERVMRPIGVPDAEWSIGYGKTCTVYR
jgi:CubicO group peptidase (beta-lactamase class C family)